MDADLDRIVDGRVVVIFRGVSPQRCLSSAQALYEADLRCFEVTLNSEGAFEAIHRLRTQLPDDAVIGAGTVLTCEQVTRAHDVGASFIISPDLNDDVVEHTREQGLVSIPGAFTATEVLRAWHSGAHMVKVFPVRPVGADYVRQLRGPIADVPLLVSGGVHARLAAECFEAGADTAGVGLPLFGIDPERDSTDTILLAGQRFLAESGVTK